MGSHSIAQAGLKLLSLSSPPTLAFQSAGITGKEWNIFSVLVEMGFHRVGQMVLIS